MKISDCRAFSPFKTLPGCRALRHSVFIIPKLKGTNYKLIKTTHHLPSHFFRHNTLKGTAKAPTVDLWKQSTYPINSTPSILYRCLSVPPPAPGDRRRLLTSEVLLPWPGTRFDISQNTKRVSFNMSAQSELNVDGDKDKNMDETVEEAELQSTVLTLESILLHVFIFLLV